MTTLTLNDGTIAACRRRREAGESLRTIATDVGVPWQKLEKATRPAVRSNGTRRAKVRHGRDEAATPAETRETTPTTARESLVDAWRPRTLADLVGQTEAVGVLRSWLAGPFPTPLLFHGGTGTGKSSAAVALARELGCAVDVGEMGGLHVIASGEQTADAVRDTCSRLWLSPMCGSGWRVLVVNEVDRMHVQAENVWLDRLESLPKHAVVIFTTNHVDKLNDRMIDRCLSVGFVDDADSLRAPVLELLARVWKQETGKQPDSNALCWVFDQANKGGHVSVRRAVQLLAPLVMAARAAESKR